MFSPEPAIVAEGVRKTYRSASTPALDGFDLTVGAGTVQGLLGPNGAGKTTAIRVLATLQRPDAGTARIAGFDVSREAARVKTRIGLVGQHTAVDEILSGRQNLMMFARLFHLDRKAARRRTDELLDRFDLADTGDKPAGQFSGGMRRRLDLAASMILAPAVLFLDEPSTGLDPRGRNEVWAAVRTLVADGTTVLLTTQYLDEADQLADRISVIDTGRVIAEGTPGELKSRIGGDHLEVVVRAESELSTAATILATVASGGADVRTDIRQVSVPVADRVAALTTAVQALTEAGVTVEDIGLRRPTLDDAFLELTGHKAAEPTTTDTVSSLPAKSEVAV